MNKSDSIIKIAPALLKAQKEIGSATKGSTNPFFHSTYADLGAIMEACKEKLNENGITVLQPVGTDERGVFVETILLHESGEFISDKMQISVKQQNDPQAQGSAITYARRYGLQSMVFIPAEDDDGEGAVEHKIPDKMPGLPKEPDQKCLKCDTGTMIFKNGYKGNKYWAGYFCQNKECGNVSWRNERTPEQVAKAQQPDPADLF